METPQPHSPPGLCSWIHAVIFCEGFLHLRLSPVVQITALFQSLSVNRWGKVAQKEQRGCCRRAECERSGLRVRKWAAEFFLDGATGCWCRDMFNGCWKYDNYENGLISYWLSFGNSPLYSYIFVMCYGLHGNFTKQKRYLANSVKLSVSVEYNVQVLE